MSADLEPWEALPVLAVTTLKDALTGEPPVVGDEVDPSVAWCIYDPSEDDPPLAEGSLVDMDLLATGWNRMVEVIRAQRQDLQLHREGGT